jgi:hypothetical protein
LIARAGVAALEYFIEKSGGIRSFLLHLRPPESEKNIPKQKELDAIINSGVFQQTLLETSALETFRVATIQSLGSMFEPPPFFDKMVITEEFSRSSIVFRSGNHVVLELPN